MTITILNNFYHPIPKISCPFAIISHSYHWNHYFAFCPYSFVFSRISYKWNDSVCGLLYLSSSAWHKAFETHLCCINSLFLFIAEKYFIVWTTVPFSIYFRNYVFGLFLVWGHYKKQKQKNCCQYSHAGLWVGIHFFSWVNT